MRKALSALAWLIGSFASTRAGEPAVEFSRDIRPILSQHCWACHGPDDKAREAGLRLDIRDKAIAKKAIVPNDPKASKLLARIESADPDKQMPPPEHKKPLTAKQKQQLRAWISQGAVYSQHWAFVAPKRPPVPGINGVINPIDAFVLDRLEREKIHPSPEADRATLLRRVTLDLTGLPPTPAELDDFLADKVARCV